MTARLRQGQSLVIRAVVVLLRRIHPPSRRALRAAMAAITVGAAVSVLQPSVASAAPVFSNTAPALDARLDPLYSQGFATVTYTQTGSNPKVITGSLSVIETPDAYYLGFQQGLNRKSNAYCEDKKTTVGCYQDFSALVNSDHISFEWANLDGRPFDVGVDIISVDANAQYGYSGTITGSRPGVRQEGDAPLGCANNASLTGFSGEDYNWHHAGAAGWGVPSNTNRDLYSPNFVGETQQYPDYVYASTAEVRLDKQLCDLANGLDLFSGFTAVAHNSPAAPTAVNPAEFGVCAASNATTGTIGGETPLTFNVLKSDGLGNLGHELGEHVLVSAADGPGTLTSVNGVSGATTGTSSTPGGTVVAGITSLTQGVTHIRAMIDLNNNGTWEPATEPSTAPDCELNVTGTPPDVHVSKSASTAAVTAPGSVTYTIATNNSGDAAATNVAIHDDLDDDLIVTAATWQVGGGGASGNCPFTAGNVMTCAVGTLARPDSANGGPDSAVATVTVTAPAAACPEIVNQAHVTASNEGQDQQTASPQTLGANWTQPVMVAVNRAPPPVISVDLIKTNDANADASFTKSEVAPA